VPPKLRQPTTSRPLAGFNGSSSRWRATVDRLGGAPVLVVLSLTAVLLSQSVTVGADTMWLVAIGNQVINQHAIPVGVPFLDADTSGWVNVPVLGEVLMAALDRAGPMGLIAAQVSSVTIVMVAITRSAMRLGAGPWGTSVSLALLVAGQLPSLGVVRAQMWSLPLFVAVVYLVRREWESPSARIWLAIPITAVWTNLHGAVLVGVAVIGAYLLFGRLPRAPLTAAAVGIAVAASLWLTPAGSRTHEYYLGVMSNVAAERREGLWAPVDPSTVFGVLLVGSCLLLLGASLRHRLRLWEYAVVVGLALMTVQSARNGIWLALWLAPRASVGFTRTVRPAGTRIKRMYLAAPVAAACAVLAIVGLAKRSTVVSSDRSTAAHLVSVIGPSQTVLAVSPMSELLAVEGARLWASNPIDALPRARQVAFLDFLSRDYAPALEQNEPPDVLILSEGDPVPTGLVPALVYGGFQIVPTKDRA